jgi:hypothetical protein
LVKIYECKSSEPEQSFSASLGEALRKSSHRIFSNEHTDVQSGHNISCAVRCMAYSYVLIVEDTTDLNYVSHPQKDGMGRLGGRGDCPGVCLHTAMALSPDATPLGILGQHLWAPSSSGQGKGRYTKMPIQDKESYKWIRTLEWCSEQLSAYTGKIVVVGDREADFYEHFRHERPANTELLVRVRNTKRTLTYGGRSIKAGELAGQLAEIGRYTIKVPRQQGKEAREAVIAVKLGSVMMPGTGKFKGDAAIPLQVVIAQEVGQSKGDPPIEWILYTTLTQEAFAMQGQDASFALLLIGFYKKRWLIERLHYILKQCLKVEDIQYDNFQRLKSALKISSVVAWYVLYTKEIAHAHPDEQASNSFDPEDIKMLTIFTKVPISTIKEYTLALAKLVKFKPTKKQPQPGETVIWKALQKFIAMKEAVEMFKKNTGQE